MRFEGKIVGISFNETLTKLLEDMETISNFKVEEVSESRINEFDIENSGFGKVFSDEMLQANYENNMWQQTEIKPYGALEVTPALNVFHYGQSVFEGLKAYYVDDNTVNLFRPKDNYERFVRSCERLCIPPVDEEVFIGGIEELIKLDSSWVPKNTGNTLYIRPFACAWDHIVAAHVSEAYRFFIITSPVGAYHADLVNLITSEHYVRAVEGGIGEAKTAGNYAAGMYPAQKAKERGYDQVLWLDAVEHTYIEEVGTMNIFFLIDDVLITPPLRGSILPGVTRDSVIELAKSWDLEVQERPISIDEVLEAGQDGRLHEAFGAGTAAVISPVKEIHHRGTSVTVHHTKRGDLGQKVYDTLTGIQYGRLDDPFDWTHPVKVKY